MKKLLSRRSTIKIIASALAIIPINASANKNLVSYYWKSSALGIPVDMKIITKNRSHLEELLFLINSEIKRFDKIFYLQDAHSKINLLNRNKVLIKPDIELLNAINLTENLFLLSKGSFDITVQTLWNSFSSDKKVDTNGIGFHNISSSSKKITLLNKNTQITLNSIAQGILTDRIHEILLNSGIKNHLINFGEGKASGFSNNNNRWRLYEKNNYIDVTNKGFAVSEPKSTILPNNKSHLFNAKIYDSALFIPNKTTVIAENATIADGLSTTYAVSDPKTQKKLIKEFPKVQFIIS